MGGTSNGKPNYFGAAPDLGQAFGAASGRPTTASLALGLKAFDELMAQQERWEALASAMGAPPESSPLYKRQEDLRKLQKDLNMNDKDFMRLKTQESLYQMDMERAAEGEDVGPMSRTSPFQRARIQAAGRSEMQGPDAMDVASRSQPDRSPGMSVRV